MRFIDYEFNIEQQKVTTPYGGNQAKSATVCLLILCIEGIMPSLQIFDALSLH